MRGIYCRYIEGCEKVVQFAEMYVLTAGVIGFGFVEVGGEYFEDELEIVIFVEDGGCMPQPDDMVEIYYETVCFLE